MKEPINWKRAGYGRWTGRPVTIGDLRRAGKVLEAHCQDCGRMAELDAHGLPFDDEEPVPATGSRMRCKVCGSKSVMTRPQVYDEPNSVRASRQREKQINELSS